MRRLIALIGLSVFLCFTVGVLVGCSEEADPVPVSQKLKTVDGNGEDIISD